MLYSGRYYGRDCEKNEVRISGLPDLSRFVQREKKVKIHNTVHLLVGEESIEVSGPVISQASTVLQRLVRKQQELYLDEFTGQMEGIQDCVELMYGGKVKLTESNIKTVTKFSAIYQVKEMFDLCIQWLKDNISNENLFSFIQIGFIGQSLGHNSNGLLDACAEFIKNKAKNGLVKMVGSSTVRTDDLMKFLVREEILRYTLPVLTSLVTNDADVKLILTEFEDKELFENLSKHGKLSKELLERMGEKVESFETTKVLHEVQAARIKDLAANTRFPLNERALFDLVGKFRTFNIDQLLQTEVSLKHFQYVDLVFGWIAHNPAVCEDDDVLRRLWATVRYRELSSEYIGHIKNGIMALKGNGYPAWTLTDDKLPGDYNSCIYTNYTVSMTIRSQDYVYKNSIGLPPKQCSICDTTFSCNIQFVDGFPRYKVTKTTDSDHQIDHVYLNHYKHCYQNSYVFFSLLTNDAKLVREKIAEILDEGNKINVSCMFKCAKNI